MEQYCTKCGAELREDARFCPHCGARTAKQNNADEWDTFGTFLERSSLGIARVFALLILSGLIFVCALCGLELFFVGAVLLYHFAANTALMLPAFLAAETGILSLEGLPLLFGGITAIFIALLFATTAIFAVRLLRTHRRSRTQPEQELHSNG